MRAALLRFVPIIAAAFAVLALPLGAAGPDEQPQQPDAAVEALQGFLKSKKSAPARKAGTATPQATVGESQPVADEAVPAPAQEEGVAPLPPASEDAAEPIPPAQSEAQPEKKPGMFRITQPVKENQAREEDYSVKTPASVAGVRGKAAVNSDAPAAQAKPQKTWFGDLSKREQPAAEPQPAQPQAKPVAEKGEKKSWFGGWFKKDKSAQPPAQAPAKAPASKPGAAVKKEEKKSFFSGWFKKDKSAKPQQQTTARVPPKPTAAPASKPAVAAKKEEKKSFFGGWFKKDKSAKPQQKATTKVPASKPTAAPASKPVVAAKKEEKKSFFGGWFKKDKSAKPQQKASAKVPASKPTAAPASKPAVAAKKEEKKSFFGDWFKKDKSAKPQQKASAKVPPSKPATVPASKPVVAAKKEEKKSSSGGWFKKDPSAKPQQKASAKVPASKPATAPASRPVVATRKEEKKSFFGGWFKKDKSAKPQQKTVAAPVAKPAATQEKQPVSVRGRNEPAAKAPSAAPKPQPVEIAAASSSKTSRFGWFSHKKKGTVALPPLAPAAPDPLPALPQNQLDYGAAFSSASELSGATAVAIAPVGRDQMIEQTVVSVRQLHAPYVGHQPTGKGEVQARAKSASAPAPAVAEMPVEGLVVEGGEIRATEPEAPAVAPAEGQPAPAAGAPVSGEAASAAPAFLKAEQDEAADKKIQLTLERVGAQFQPSSKGAELFQEALQENSYFWHPSEIKEVPRITLSAREQPLGYVLQQIAGQLRLQLDVDKNSQAFMNDTVSIHFEGTPFNQALDWLLGYYNLPYRIQEGRLHI